MCGLGVSWGALGTAALGQLGVLLAEMRSELLGDSQAEAEPSSVPLNSSWKRFRGGCFGVTPLALVSPNRTFCAMTEITLFVCWRLRGT